MDNKENDRGKPPPPFKESMDKNDWHIVWKRVLCLYIIAAPIIILCRRFDDWWLPLPWWLKTAIVSILLFFCFLFMALSEVPKKIRRWWCRKKWSKKRKRLDDDSNK